MKLNELEHALDTFGADLDAWPVDKRPEAEALLAASAEARKMVEAHRRFASLFLVDGIPAPPSTAAIVGLATARPQEGTESPLGVLLRFFRFPVDAPWLKPAAVAACMLVGITIGVLDNAGRQSHDDPLELVDGSVVSENADE